MPRTLGISLVVFLAFFIMGGPASAGDIVFLRTNCGTLSPCVTTSTALEGYITANPPGALAPLTVDIGPGEFGSFSCNNTKNLNLRGAGRGETVFGGSQASFGMKFAGCTELDIQDLTARGTTIGIEWTGSGTATITNANVEAVVGPTFSAGGFGWWDHDCGQSKAKIFWFGSMISSASNGLVGVALYPQCAEHWVYGTDIVAEPSDDGYSDQMTFNLGVYLTGGSVRVFGGTVRAAVGKAVHTTFTGTPIGFAGVYVTGGSFHMHGGLITANAVGSTRNVDVFGIFATLQTFVHTPGTAFSLSAGQSGQAIRLGGSGTIKSPFLWSAGDTPPLGAQGSLTGQDLFVETDCGAINCSGGGDSHLMVYQESCNLLTGSPWFDIVTGACRQP